MKKNAIKNYRGIRLRQRILEHVLPVIICLLLAVLCWLVVHWL